MREQMGYKAPLWPKCLCWAVCHSCPSPGWACAWREMTAASWQHNLTCSHQWCAALLARFLNANFFKLPESSLISLVSPHILYWDEAEFNLPRVCLALNHLPQQHQKLIWTCHLKNHVMSRGEQESTASFNSALCHLHSPRFHLLTIHNHFLMPGNSSHQPCPPICSSLLS